jgi:MoxR-like ATPase
VAVAAAPFAGIDEVQSELAAQQYVCDRRVATVVFLATAIGKPMLIEGPAGVGKTELAKALAATLDRKLIRLQCYEGLDESKALYEWEYGKQLLYTQVLREKIGELIGPTRDLREAAELLRGQEDVFFSDAFLVERPILEAIRSDDAPVLLLDEIDRADEEFEAFLLEFLSDYQVSIPEVGTQKATRPPIVVLTSNRSRELSEALKRRCVHLLLDYPEADVEREIVRLKSPGIGDELAEELVAKVQELRQLDLRKSPSIGETLDWAQALVVLGAADLSADVIEQTLSVVVKYDRDASRVLESIGRGGGHSHDGHGHHHHGPGHTHDHDHSH